MIAQSPNYIIYNLNIIYFKMQPAHRDRPLQNSMFLTQTHNNRRGSIDYLNNNMGPMKKNISVLYMNNESHYHPINKVPSTQMTQNNLNFLGNRNFQGEEQSKNEFSSTKKIQQSLGQLNERLERMGRFVDRHENQLNLINIQNYKQQLSRQVLNEIRQLLPRISANGDLYDHILGMKAQIKNLKLQIDKLPTIHDLEVLEESFKGSTHETLGKKLKQAHDNNSKSQSSFSGLNDHQEFSQMLRQRDQYFKNLLSSFEYEISLVKKVLNNHCLQMKVSPISSSSCIMLKYQEIIKTRSKIQDDLILNQHTYYIDNEGHLLDSNSRYLVNQKGKKVKLQDKHITILKNHKILQ